MIKGFSSEKNLGTLTWSAITDPSGTVTKKYRWYKIGNSLQFWFKISATVSGVGVTAVQFDLPSDVPSPALWSSQPSDVIVAIGTGALGAGTNPSIATADGLKLFNNSGTYALVLERSGAISANNAWGNISFMV